VLDVEAEVVHTQIQRMLSSKTFESSETQRRLLQYLADKALSGDAERLKEYTVGIEAFGKPSTYDPQEDSIVRTQTGRLRGKLREYYATEGQGDPVVVDLPKGGFRLNLQPKSTQDSQSSSRVPVLSSPGDLDTSKAGWWVNARLPWALCAILAVCCGGLAYRLSAVQNPDRLKQAEPAPWPLSRVINGREPTTIIGEDVNLPRLRTIAGRRFQLDEYLSKDFPKPFLPPTATERESQLLSLLSHGAPFGNATVQDVRSIMAIAPSSASSIKVRSPREVEARDFRDGSYILIGSPISNPWASVFEPYLNFQEVDETLQHGYKYFANKHPQPGELARYQGISSGDRNGIAYGSLALIPNERRSANLLLLEGLQAEGTEAAGILLSDRESCRKLRQALIKLGADPNRAWFEALIRANSVDATPTDVQIVSVRLIHISGTDGTVP
jgi:hypothetical protein